MYATDLTEAQWQFIKSSLNIEERKRKYDLRLMWNAIFYLNKTGCQWRMLPKEFPKWQLVYYYYRIWSETENFDLILDKVRRKVRENRGQNQEASLGILDSQSVRWGNNRALNGIDGNKKVKGIKRHMVVDKNGFLIAVMVCVANIHDSKAALFVMRMLKECLCKIKVILADGGYRGELANTVKQTYGYIINVVMRSDKPNPEFCPVNKRWVIERSFAWLDNDRRLCRNYEFLPETSENMVKIAAIKFLLNKI